MKIFDYVQGSPEWWKIRTGIPTSSEFSRICTPATEKFAKGATAYIDELVAATLGWKKSFQGSPDTERGHRMESEARRW